MDLHPPITPEDQFQEEDEVRNPERIDLKKYPSPPGYVVASEGDCGGRVKAPREWMYFGELFGKLRWCKCSGVLPLANDWTYLRPITPEDHGDQHDTDHQFPG